MTLLDIAPNAVQYTQENIASAGLSSGVQDAVVGKIENLDPKYGPFDAVVGTFTFPFIPPQLFDDVMRNNVLGRIKPGGYFAGGFFGENHAWAKDPKLTIMTVPKIEAFFASMGFEICETKEETEESQTVLNGKQVFHTINVIAKRLLKPE